MTLSATSLPENAAAATALLAQSRPALVWRRIIADSDTPVGAARRLIVPGRGDFLLESVEGGEVRVVDRVLYEAVGDAQAVEQADGVGLRRHAYLPGFSESRPRLPFLPR